MKQNYNYFLITTQSQNNVIKNFMEGAKKQVQISLRDWFTLVRNLYLSVAIK